jgi:hypothetical protein
MLPKHFSNALKDGYKITEKRPICWTPIPKPALQSSIRYAFICLEATFSYIFWAMRTVKYHSMSSFCPWDRTILAYNGCWAIVAYPSLSRGISFFSQNSLKPRLLNVSKLITSITRNQSARSENPKPTIAHFAKSRRYHNTDSMSTMRLQLIFEKLLISSIPKSHSDVLSATLLSRELVTSTKNSDRYRAALSSSNLDKKHPSGLFFGPFLDLNQHYSK